MGRRVLWAVALTLAFAPVSAAQAPGKRVLILHSFERRFSPDDLFARDFRSAVNDLSAEPVTFFEMSLQPAPARELLPDSSALEYLESILARHRLDLVVTISEPAATFVTKYRERLFPSTPIFLAAVERRWVESESSANVTALAIDIDVRKIVADILRVLPDTRTVFVVLGHTPLEQAWADIVRRETQPFTDRVQFVLSNDMSFVEITKRAAALPPHSAILYGILSVDAAGFSQSEDHTLAELRKAAAAPIFGLYDSQMERGTVGGPQFSIDDLVRDSANVALRILRGESPGNVRTPVHTLGTPRYNWRELQRWNISESRLPIGSTVLFRQQSAWDQYRPHVIGIVVIVGLQALLISGLVVQGIRRRRTELALRESEQRFRVMADTAPVLIWRSGIDKACDFFNKPWLEFRGRTYQQECGSGWIDGVHPVDRADCLRTYVAAFDAREPFSMEYRLQRADGVYRWVIDAGVPRYDERGTFAGFIGSALDITERKDIEQANRELAGRLIHAQETERIRIARDLHDDVGQQLAGFAIMLSGLKRRIGTPGERADVALTLSTLQDRTATLADTVRSLSHELHPSVLEHAGLVAALERLCSDAERHHRLHTTFAAEGDFDALTPEVGLCLFRVAQEALGNAARHARARTIDVRLIVQADCVELLVQDDGIGFDGTARRGHGLGLRSIDERVRLQRGQMRIDSERGAGTQLFIQIPR